MSGGAGVQLLNAERAVRDVACGGAVLGADATWIAVTGDGERILSWLACG